MNFSMPLVIKATFRGEMRRLVERVGQEDCLIGLYKIQPRDSETEPVDPVIARARRALGPEYKIHEHAIRCLEKALRRVFGIPSGAPLKLTYKDDEGDVITLGSYRDLEDAFELQKLNPLRIDVVLVPDVLHFRPNEKAEGQLGDGLHWKVKTKKDCTKLKIFHRLAAHRERQGAKVDARFVKDNSFPDGAIVRPGQIFTKEWTMRNTGAMDWPAKIFLVRVGGDNVLPMDAKLTRGGNEFVPIELPEQGVKQGAESTVGVSLQAPNEPGRYTTFFRLGHVPDERPQDETGALTGNGDADAAPMFKRFGHRIWCQVNVVPEGSAVEDLPSGEQPANTDLSPLNSAFVKPVVKLAILSLLSDLRGVDAQGKIVGVGAIAIKEWAQHHPFFIQQPQATKSVEILMKQVSALANRTEMDTVTSEDNVVKEELQGPAMRDLVHTIFSELHVLCKDGSIVAGGPGVLDTWSQNHPVFRKGENGHKGIKVLKRQVKGFVTRPMLEGAESTPCQAMSGDVCAKKFQLALQVPETAEKCADTVNGTFPIAFPVNHGTDTDEKEWVNVSGPKDQPSSSG